MLTLTTIDYFAYQQTRAQSTNRYAIVENYSRISAAVQRYLVVHNLSSLKTVASARNRTRAARVAGEHSTTEPPMLTLTTIDYFAYQQTRAQNCHFMTSTNTISLDMKLFAHICCSTTLPSRSQSFIAKTVASAGNRTRAARVAGEHSTTEPPMLTLTSKLVAMA
uniref:Uncharacterized protein n=1 Tax=Heterorhabditis bacteriophora TaxID=37862 RepID=A0A1I7WDJ0_HETBA